VIRECDIAKAERWISIRTTAIDAPSRRAGVMGHESPLAVGACQGLSGATEPVGRRPESVQSTNGWSAWSLIQTRPQKSLKCGMRYLCAQYV